MPLFDILPPYVLSILAFAGTYCLIFAYYKQYHVQIVMKNGYKTTGTVVDIYKDPWNKESVCLVVDYIAKTGTGGIFKYYSNGYPLPCPYEIGQEVKIWIKPDKLRSTGRAALEDEQPGKLPIILFSCGLVMCLLSYPEIIRRIFNLLLNNVTV